MMLSRLIQTFNRVSVQDEEQDGESHFFSGNYDIKKNKIFALLNK